MKEIDRLRDKADLFDHINNAPCYISFFTRTDGTGYALREILNIKGKHYDKKVERAADKKARQLGAKGWIVLKPIGGMNEVYYEDDNNNY